jgi:hypothetical protein
MEMFPTYGTLTDSTLGGGTKQWFGHYQPLATPTEDRHKGLACSLVEELEKIAGPTDEVQTETETETETDVDIRGVSTFITQCHNSLNAHDLALLTGFHLPEAELGDP